MARSKQSAIIKNGGRGIEQDEEYKRLLKLELEVEAENKVSMQAENDAELEDYLADHSANS